MMLRLGMIACALALAVAPARAAQGARAPAYLEQGWTDAERQTYYNTPQGSDILPYAWFVALEQPWNDQPFRDDAHLASFNYLLNSKSTANPDGLPIGFVKSTDKAGKSWMGMSCAACHTGQIEYKGQAVRIDGGTTLADVLAFQTTLVEALEAMLAQPAKLARFTRRVLGAGATAAQRAELADQVRTQLVQMQRWQGTSRPAHQSGYGTWDAINILMNTIDATALAEPSNNRTPEVPVSYPPIWLTTKTDWLLWNASIQNSTVRAVGEVIIVFGRAKVTVENGKFDFSTSADVLALHRIYDALDKLKAPVWPEKMLGAIDAKKAEAGAKIYEREGCVKCHANKAPYPMTPKDASGFDYIAINHTPLAEVGTDPLYAMYFVQRTAIPALMAPLFKGTALEGQTNIPAALLFLLTLTEITASAVKAVATSPVEEQRLLGFRALPTLPKTKAELDGLVQSLLAYKAAPLAGVWSTAPYLHNASVPTLHDLLLPPEQRPKSFTLGSHEFDPDNVGYRTAPFPGGYRFDTAKPGQSNGGHLYGTKITEEERRALLEYLKTL